MAVKIKESAKPKKDHKPRFDFTSDHWTGTIDELIEELNTENPKDNGERITFSTLEQTLAFFTKVTGIQVENDCVPIPLSVLKTIKLLFLARGGTKRYLFDLLDPPSPTEKPTMEFSTGTTIPRDKEASGIIESMIENLAIEIPSEKLAIFRNLLGNREKHTTAENLLLHIERANDQVTRILTDIIRDDDRGLANAYYALSKRLDSIRYQVNPNPTTPAHEAVFVYLDTLAIRHFILHHRKHIKETKLNQSIADISTEVDVFCKQIGDKRESQPTPYDRLFSVNNFHHVVFGYHKEVTAIVKSATGFDTRKKQLFENTARAKALLVSYIYRSFDETDADACLLSIYDIIAALCSFRYQQEAGGDYSPYWPGQVSQGNSPQRLFDKGLRKRDPHQHQGVFQIYYNRFAEYQAAFTGTRSSYYAWMGYQLSRIAAYYRIIQINSIIAMSTAATSLDFLCIEQAMEVALEYPNISL